MRTCWAAFGVDWLVESWLLGRRRQQISDVAELYFSDVLVFVVVVVDEVPNDVVVVIVVDRERGPVVAVLFEVVVVIVIVSPTFQAHFCLHEPITLWSRKSC